MLRAHVETLKMDGGSAWMEVVSAESAHGEEQTVTHQYTWAVVPHTQQDESKVYGSLTWDWRRTCKPSPPFLTRYSIPLCCLEDMPSDWLNGRALEC